MLSKQYIIFYSFGLLNLILWVFLFFIYLPLFQGNNYVFLLDTNLFNLNGVSVNDLDSKLQINPLFLFLCCFIFSIGMFGLKFYFRDRNLILILISLFNLLFSFGGLVSSPSLISKLKTLSSSFSDQASLGWFNVVWIKYNRTPEETWECICSYIKMENRYSILLEKDKADLYNYIITIKPNMSNCIHHLDVLYKKREAMTVSTIESIPDVTQSAGFFDLVFPYFTYDYYYIGLVCTTLIGCGLCFLAVTLNSHASQLDSLSKQVNENTIPVIGDRDLDPVQIKQLVLKDQLDVVDAKHIQDSFELVRQSLATISKKLDTVEPEIKRIDTIYTKVSEIEDLTTENKTSLAALDKALAALHANFSVRLNDHDSKLNLNFLQQQIISVLSKLNDDS